MDTIEFLLQYLPQLLQGTLVTLAVSGISIVAATILGLFLSMARISSSKIVRWLSGIYIWIMRGTPVLLVLYFMYFAAPQIGIRLPAFAAAVIGITLSSTAYKAEIFRSGIQAVPKGQVDAANAVGMSYWLQMRRVIVPQAVKIVTPPYINNAILMVKNSALVSVITVQDLMLTSTQIVSSTFRALEILGMAGLIYLVINSGLMILQHYSEKKFAVGSK